MRDVDARLTNLFARTTTPALVTALLTLEASERTHEHIFARAKTIEELERRYPEASAAVEAAFDESERLLEAGIGIDNDVDYVAVLVAAIPADQII